MAPIPCKTSLPHKFTRRSFKTYGVKNPECPSSSCHLVVAALCGEVLADPTLYRSAEACTQGEVEGEC
jgi:hypothetical protein